MQDTLLMVFTGILAFAVLVQSLIFLGIYQSIRRMTALITDLGKDLHKNTEAISSKVEEALQTIKSTAESIKPITQNLVGTTQIVHNRVIDIDRFLAETTSTARLEIMRIQDTVQFSLRRAEEAIEILRNSILVPVNEINAVARAIRISFDVLFRRRRTPSNISAQDEEMFI